MFANMEQSRSTIYGTIEKRKRIDRVIGHMLARRAIFPYIVIETCSIILNFK